MQKPEKLVLAALAVITLFVPLVAAQSTKTLEVEITYSGAGTVDSTHQIHLYLFDTPDISGGAMPIAWNSSSSNGASVKFTGLTDGKVYLVVAYGDYDVTMGPPPSGTPVAFYAPGDPMPTAIELTEPTTQISFRFDDSVRMP